MDGLAVDSDVVISEARRRKWAVEVRAGSGGGGGGGGVGRVAVVEEEERRSAASQVGLGVRLWRAWRVAEIWARRGGGGGGGGGGRRGGSELAILWGWILGFCCCFGVCECMVDSSV